MSPGTTRSRHRARTPSETCGAARVSPWGQRAPRWVQAFALSLPPGSEMILLTQNDSLYIITGSDSGAQRIKKEPSRLFFFSPPTEWRNAPCLHFWQGNDNSTWRKINNPDIFGEFKGWSLWLFVWISNWKWRNYVGGAEGQARSCISQQQQQFLPHPKLHVKIKKNFSPKKRRRRRWNLGRGNSKRRSFFLSCSRSSRRKNG